MGTHNNKSSNIQKEAKNQINDTNISYSYSNLNLIKSIHITKKILSYLDKRKELNLIKYNNKFKSHFGYNIEDYKNISKIYIKVSKDGIIKEYLIE